MVIPACGFDGALWFVGVGFEEGEHVVGVGFLDFAGDAALAAHGVEGNDAAGQLEGAQEFRARR